MSKLLLEKARTLVQAAQKRGAQGVRAGAYRQRSSSLEWRDGKVDRLRESTSMGVQVSLFVDGRYSVHSTSDLRPDALERFLDETVAMTRLLAPDEHRKLPDPARYGDRFAGDLGLFDAPGVAATDGALRRKIAAALEDAARAAPGADQIISVTTTFGDTHSQGATVTSNGMEGTSERSSFSLFAEVSVKDAGGRKPEGYDYDVSRKRDLLRAVEQLGAGATRRALDAVGASPEKSGEYACVIENRVVGSLLGNLIGPLGGGAIQQKRSFLADKMDQQVAAEVLTAVSDPHVPAGLGSRAFDGEGMSTRKMTLFDKGVVKTFLLDTYFASKLGLKPTSGGTTNLVFPSAGKRDLESLLAAMGDGILVTGFSGGNSNSATGDFSIGVKGHWIQGGRRSRPLAEMNLAGNHLKFWNKLVELGQDADVASSWRCPSFRFSPVQFSGV